MLRLARLDSAQIGRNRRFPQVNMLEQRVAVTDMYVLKWNEFANAAIRGEGTEDLPSIGERVIAVILGIKSKLRCHASALSSSSKQPAVLLRRRPAAGPPAPGEIHGASNVAWMSRGIFD
nr:hypothetical protein [Acidisphaera sp. S103]